MLCKCKDLAGRCFARNNDKCMVLRDTTFKSGICPFKKPERDVSFGKKYATYDRNAPYLK